MLDAAAGGREMNAVAAECAPSGGSGQQAWPVDGRSDELDPSHPLMRAVDEASLIKDGRDITHATTPVPDRMSGWVLGGSFVLALGLWFALVPPAALPLGALAFCISVHALAASVEFETSTGWAIPTTPVLVVSLFVLPPQLVPLVALGGLLVASGVIRRLRDPGRRERLPVLAGSAWHSMGPAVVFAIAGVTSPSLGALPILALALGAQYVCDFGATWIRNCYGLGVPTVKLVQALRFTFAVDLMLAPLGLAAAFAAPGSPIGLLFLVGPTLLLAMLQRDRENHISRSVMLSEAFARSADKARRDALTGLRNRLAWEEALVRYAESPSSVAVILADVDGLKATNDALGHDAGDRLLIGIAALIAQVTPSDSDAIAARLGGDEFGILLPGGLAGEAKRIADQLRASMELACVDGLRTISASIGYGVAPTGAMLSFAFVEADRGVYEDKSARSVGRR